MNTAGSRIYTWCVHDIIWERDMAERVAVFTTLLVGYLNRHQPWIADSWSVKFNLLSWILRTASILTCYSQDSGRHAGVESTEICTSRAPKVNISTRSPDKPVLCHMQHAYGQLICISNAIAFHCEWVSGSSMTIWCSEQSIVIGPIWK